MRRTSQIPSAGLLPLSVMLCLRLLLLSLLVSAVPLSAQLASRDALSHGIERAQALPAAALDTKIDAVQIDSAAGRNSEIFLRFARLRHSVAANNSAAIASDSERILAVAQSLGDSASFRIVCAELANTLARAGGISPPSAARESETQQTLNLLRLEQLRVADAEKRSKDQQITALRAQGQLIAAERMRQQLIELQRNQQLQLESITRRSELKSMLSLLLLALFLLTVALAWSLWRTTLARKQQALEDHLTGLKNRRFLSAFMQHETERLRRNSLTALILIADIDFFKKINDHWGHDIGDEALVQLAKILRGCVRNSDIVARWGGEEFVMICPQSSEEHASAICNRIRKHLQQTPIVDTARNISFQITLSIGATLFSPANQEEHWETALGRADQALYNVKHNGRDNWSLAPQTTTPADPHPINA